MPNLVVFEDAPDIDSALQDITQEQGSITYQDTIDIAGIAEIVKEGCRTYYGRVCRK